MSKDGALKASGRLNNQSNQQYHMSRSGTLNTSQVLTAEGPLVLEGLVITFQKNCRSQKVKQLSGADETRNPPADLPL